MHHFHTQVGTVDDVCPGANDTTLAINHRLVEVESIQVERHGADAQCSKPDANHRPCTQEEVQAAAVVEGRILEDQPTEVAMSCHDVVGLFFFMLALNKRLISRYVQALHEQLFVGFPQEVRDLPEYTGVGLH